LAISVDIERPYRMAAYAAALAVQAVMAFLVAASRVTLAHGELMYVLPARPTATALHVCFIVYLALRILRDASGEDHDPKADLFSGTFVVTGVVVLSYLYASLTADLALLLTGSVISIDRYRYPHKIAVISALCGSLVAVALADRALQAALVFSLYWASAVLVLLVLHGYHKRYMDLSERSEKALWSATEFVKANVRLQHNAAVSDERGRQSERERLAREIHDTVGHSLTSILMQVRMLKFMIRALPPRLEDAAAEIDGIEHALIDTITDVRKEVATLRETPAVQINWVVRWRSLCRNFAESTGAHVIIKVPDFDVDLPNDIGLAVFRIMQEALTNAIRHGKATTVDVTALHKRDLGRLYLRISDNGVGAKKTVPGNGLSGIQERVQELDGEVSWLTLPGKGFDIGVSLPLGETRNAENESGAGGRPSGLPARPSHAAGE